jgi:hypothetical protein
MYPSGVWAGFWEQDVLGRQPMNEFELHFRPDGTIRGHGRDVVGRFTFSGDYHLQSGRVELVKQYLGKHQVVYVGHPDGEGSILGTWTISFLGLLETRGSFALKPVLKKPTGEEPIHEIR